MTMTSDDLWLCSRAASPDDAGRMDRDNRIVMLDPTTDQLLAECTGPDAGGRCPMSDRPPYICAGLHVVSVGADSGHESFTVVKMQPGRCPMAGLNEARTTPERYQESNTPSRSVPTATG